MGSRGRGNLTPGVADPVSSKFSESLEKQSGERLEYAFHTHVRLLLQLHLHTHLHTDEHVQAQMNFKRTFTFPH